MHARQVPTKGRDRGQGAAPGTAGSCVVADRTGLCGGAVLIDGSAADREGDVGWGRSLTSTDVPS